MPEDVGYVLYEDQNPPSTGDINAARGGLVWKGPQGIFRVEGGNYYPVTEEQFAAWFPPEPVAEVQAEAVEGAEPVAPAAEAVVPSTPSAGERDLGGGVTAGEFGRASGTRETVVERVERRRREEAAKATAVAGGQERAAAAGPFGGLSLGERGQATELIRTNPGMTEEEAAAEIVALRPPVEAQAGAIE